MRARIKSGNIILYIILILSVLLNIYLFHSTNQLTIPNNNHSYIENTIKLGTIIYNNPELIEHVKNKVLIPPSGIFKQSSTTNVTYYSQIGQDKFVDELLKQRRNGFYLEVGAYDGEFISNTIFFERERHWTGLLIEANPKLFKKLECRQRNAYLSNTCVSTNSYAIEVVFTFADYLTGQKMPTDKSLITGRGSVQCFPIMTYLMALNITHIDYFSLDIEGGEVDVLKQINYKTIQIDVFTIEYVINYHRSPESLAHLKQIDDFLIGTGLYRQVKTISDLDVVFIRKSLYNV
ncbi:hypothetical protein I4U23_005940 [Adineta vaga]|nr:hypothetical protein I4U23_005940 [Adineta vaga]